MWDWERGVASGGRQVGRDHGVQCREEERLRRPASPSRPARKVPLRSLSEGGEAKGTAWGLPSTAGGTSS